MKRISLFIGLSIMIVGTTTACGNAQETRERVLSYIVNTENLSRQFVYEEEEGGEKIQVSGRIEDTFRYRQSLRLAEVEVSEIIANDDALALRIVSPAELPGLTQASLLPESQIVAETLMAGGWVIDPSAAPPLFRDAGETPEVQALKPFIDAVTVLRHVRLAISEAQNVRQWREEDLDPVYRPTEDNFPKPDDAQGVRRFDLERIPVPRPPSAAAGGTQDPPRVASFRKMAIYVKGDRIIRVMEEIDVEGHKDFVEARRENKTLMLEFLENIKKNNLGGEPIAPRMMSVTFTNLAGKITVGQPEGALTASLKSILATIGRSQQTDIAGIPISPSTPPEEASQTEESPTG